MITGSPETTPIELGSASHGGEGNYNVKTLLNEIPESSCKYVRDLTLKPKSSIGIHRHDGDDEIYFIISGSGIMIVDDEKLSVGPGTVVLTLSGSSHGLCNAGDEDLRILVLCVQHP